MRKYLAILALLFSPYTVSGPLKEVVSPLGFDELMASFTEAGVARLLGPGGQRLPEDDHRAAALLISLGAIRADELGQVSTVEKAQRFVSVLAGSHPALMGRLGDAALYDRMAEAFDHDSLLAENELTLALAKALDRGVITGYDLRARGVYDDLPEGLTFIYSQSSLDHMRQLVTLLHAEQVQGWVSITPKVSAFLYREDWGPASERVRTLPGGLRVVNGREIAVMFQFDTHADLARFHGVIERHAKKDAADEPGLIINAWWQPFYYTDQPFAEFREIALVVVSSEHHEATLTVVPERAELVRSTFADGPWAVRVDTVWVNPPFYRFLNGDYR